MIIHDEEIVQNIITLLLVERKDIPLELEDNGEILDPLMHSLRNKINAVLKEEGIYVFRLLVNKLK